MNVNYVNPVANFKEFCFYNFYINVTLDLNIQARDLPNSFGHPSNMGAGSGWGTGGIPKTMNPIFTYFPYSEKLKQGL